MTEGPIFSDDPIMAAMQQSQLDAKSGKKPVEKVVEIPIVPKAETVPAEKVEVVVPKAETVPAEKVVEKPIVPKVETTSAAKVEEAPPVKVKSFDEELFEKTGGKLKTVAEIESLLNAPKIEFADENIAHWNELAKKGIKIDKEFLELQTKNYEDMTDPVEIKLEAMRMKPEYKGLSKDALQVQLNKQYNLNEWIDKDEADMSVEDKANREIMMRDAELDRDTLINYKNERVLEKKQDPAALQALADEAKLHQDIWEKFVETDLVNKITKLSVPLNEKGDETFDYELPLQDRKDVGEIMKAVTKDPMVFFGQFLVTDDKGNVKRNHAALTEMMLWYKNRDKVVSLAHADGIAKEALRREKEDKNTNFTQAESGNSTKTFQTPQDALADAFQKQKM